MSILGYLPDEGVCTYHGINARGRNETLRGAWRDGVIEFRTVSRPGVAAARTRVGPFGERGFAIVSEVQAAGGSWARQDQSLYKRLDR